MKRPLPSKRAWGCGFDKCKGVFDTWEGRCDHVATHFEYLAQGEDNSSQPSQWKYTNLIRNLLRQPDVKDVYRRVMIKCYGEDSVFWPSMIWQAHNTTELKRRLEYRDFREGVKEIANAAVQLGHPASSEAVQIVMETADSPDNTETPNSPAAPQNPNYLSHIDKFPQPGTNPFDLYGPVPPSPIIQLDFLSDLNDPDPEITHMHSTKSSISGIPYSLYPAPTVIERELASKGPGPFTPPDLVHDITIPTEQITFSTAATWSTAFSTAKDGIPPRPKTPLSMIRSAKSLIKKKSQVQMLPQATAVPFDPVSAQRELQFYHAR
jgi:hypothetical protein